MISNKSLIVFLQKRVFVYKNGDSTDHAVMIWGESLTQLLENSTLKLGLWKPAKKFYTEEGKKVSWLEQKFCPFPIFITHNYALT